MSDEEEDLSDVRQVQAQHAEAIAAKFAAGTFSVEFTSESTSRKYVVRGVSSEDYAQFEDQPSEVSA